MTTPINEGRTTFLFICSVLVMFMIIPGLALYYSGAVRDKNVLATIHQIISIVCIITITWMVFGYSITFAPTMISTDFLPIYGNDERLWLLGMSIETRHQLAPDVPEYIFCLFQLTFAIITPCLICGAFAERLKYPVMCLFMVLFHLLVYCPIAHSIWHPLGFLYKLNDLDFAGGNVVHISSGVAGLVSSIIIGKRRGFPEEKFKPSNILITYIGTCMLWIGWFGFNAGSAISSGYGLEVAMSASLATQISTSIAALMWMLVEWTVRKQPSVLGMVNGAVAGLVCITPGAGYVDMTGAFIIGFMGGPLCYLGIQLKHYLGIDDALDAFGVHAVGGIVGGIGTGFFATPRSGISLARGVVYTSLTIGGNQLLVQIYAILFTVCWSGCVSFLLLKILDFSFGLRVSPEHEDLGLDFSIHGESMTFGAVEDQQERKISE